MKIIKEKIRTSLGGNAFESFAKKHELIYSNDVNDHDQPIKGVTLANKRSDKHFVQGAASGHDIAAVQRTVSSRDSGKKYPWVILQASTETLLPHMFIDGHQHSKDIYASVFSAFGHYRKLNEYFKDTSPSFAHFFNTYGEAKDALNLQTILNQKVLNIITDHGKNYDFEFEEHSIRVYNQTSNIDEDELEKMFILAQNIVHCLEIDINSG